MEANVYDFVKPNVDRLPWTRSDTAFVPNGSKAKPWALAQFDDDYHTVGKVGMQENVHAFVEPIINPNQAYQYAA